MSKVFPTTKEKLNALVQGFQDFDTEMKKGTKQRKENDEKKISDLKAEMTRLDTNLEESIQRRTTLINSIQQSFDSQINIVNENLLHLLDQRKQETFQRLDELNERIDKLVLKVDEDKAHILRSIDEKGIELNALLKQFKTEFEEDRAKRLLKEELLLKTLSDQEVDVELSFTKQTEAREAISSKLRLMLEENIKLRDKTNEKFHEFFEKEIHTLHNQLTHEMEVREAEDDEIVGALNTYTLKLQNSLQIINSIDPALANSIL